MSQYVVTKKLTIAELRVGMFVTRLEVPWSATEFPLQGVLLTSQQDIDKVSRYGAYVFIDQNKSIRSVERPIARSVAQLATDDPSRKKPHPPRSWRKFCTQLYQKKHSIAFEIDRARKLLSQFDETFKQLSLELTQITPKSVGAIYAVSHEIVASILDNPDALLWLLKVRESHGRVSDHTLRAAVWAVLLGRSLGIRQASLQAMCEALLLSGIGKSALSDKNWRDYQVGNINEGFARWSAITLLKLRQCRVDPQILTIIGNMNERYDGSGFPRQKSAQAIPYLSQIASLAETFDLLLYPMPGDKKRLFSQALARLYCFSDRLFDRELIEAFIQATGLYPAGCPVVLSNGYRGVVVEQSKERRLRATVAITHDPQNYRLLRYQVVQLGQRDFKDVLIRSEAPLNPLNSDDHRRINQLVAQYQRNALRRVVGRISHFFNASAASI